MRLFYSNYFLTPIKRVHPKDLRYNREAFVDCTLTQEPQVPEQRATCCGALTINVTSTKTRIISALSFESVMLSQPHTRLQIRAFMRST